MHIALLSAQARLTTERGRGEKSDYVEMRWWEETKKLKAPAVAAFERLRSWFYNSFFFFFRVALWSRIRRVFFLVRFSPSIAFGSWSIRLCVMNALYGPTGRFVLAEVSCQSGTRQCIFYPGKPDYVKKKFFLAFYPTWLYHLTLDTSISVNLDNPTWTLKDF